MRKTLNLLGLAALLILCWITWDALWGPHRLPDRVPTHFDGGGHPNAWGPPTGMILLPVVAGVLFVLMTLVARFPGAFHYPVRVTRLNTERLQAITLDMIAWLKVENSCLFLVLQWAFIQSARTDDGHLFPMILPFFIVAIFGTVGWHFVAMFRLARAG